MAFHGLHVCFDKTFRASGPGDTLRFVHALRAYLSKQPQDEVRVITAQASLKMVSGLFSDVPGPVVEQNPYWSACNDPPVIWNANPVLDKATSLVWNQDDQSRLTHFVCQAASVLTPSDLDTLVHAYAGYGVRDLPTWINAGAVKILSVRIDSGTHMNTRRWRVPPSVTRCDDGRIAVAIRRIGHRLDTPTALISLVRQTADETDTRLRFFGTDTATYDELEIPDDARTSPSGRSFLEQIQDLGATCVAAVGVNSGGLDLATAAGLPTLRIAEYQATGYWYGDKELGNLGAAYNSYLSNALVVGLQPPYDSAQWWADAQMDRIRHSLRSFFTLVANRDERLLQPRHVLLPRDVPLTAEKLDGQVADYEVVP